MIGLPLPAPSQSANPRTNRGLRRSEGTFGVNRTPRTTTPRSASAAPRVTQQGDTASISVWRLALVVPGALLVERALTDWLPRAGMALAGAAPAVQLGVVAAMFAGLTVAWCAVLRREVGQ